MKRRVRFSVVSGARFFCLVYVLVPQVECNLYAGNLDKPSSEDIKFIIHRLEAMRYSKQKNTTEEPFSEVGKCGFRIGFDALRVWEYFTPQQQIYVASLLDPPLLQTDTVIGRFRIHYDTTGFNEPALLDLSGQRIPGSARGYVDSTGKMFNDVWNFEIDTLGYTAPPLEPGELFHNVYIVNLGSGFYGQTVPYPYQPTNPGQTPPRYSSYVEVHNDFQFFFSQGMKGLEVTAAHEFHHTVQLGSYGYWPNDIYFYEITSTWMEDVVYDDVNDYYQYIKFTSGRPRGHFETPHRSFNISDGLIEYSRAIWGKYVEKRFSRSKMRRIWEYMRQESSLPAISSSLNEEGMSLREAYAEFSVWNYFTGNRADTLSYYTEGRNYPEIKIRDTLRYQNPLVVFSDNIGVQSLGVVYHRLFLDPGGTISVVPIILKANLAEAGNGSSESYQYTVRSSAQGDDSFIELQVQGYVYWVKVGGVGNLSDWSLFHVTDSTIVAILSSESLVYPNPFYIPAQPWVRFQIPQVGRNSASLYIFSSNLDLTFSDDQASRSSVVASPFFMWNGRKANGEYASSGIYFYVIQLDDQHYTGKFTLIRK